MDRQMEFVLRTLEERDIRFVRLWFTDVLGFLKSVAIAPAELEGAFEEGIGFDGSSIEGFARERSDVLALTERLVSADGRYEVTPPTAKSTDDDNFYPWKLDASMQIRPDVKPAKSSKPDTAAATPKK